MRKRRSDSAKLALACVHKESEQDCALPHHSDGRRGAAAKTDTGGFAVVTIWHSSVHGIGCWSDCPHFSEASLPGAARDALKQSLSAENLKQKRSTFWARPVQFERPYGLCGYSNFVPSFGIWDDRKRGNGRRI